jgi:hypothetical protein
MKDKTAWLAGASGLISLALLYAGYRTTGFQQDVLVSLFSTFLGAAIGLAVVNVFLDRRSKRIAAMPLAQLIQGPIAQFHDDFFITLGRNKFGTARFNELIDDYQNNGRDPVALSPEQRQGISEIIDEHKDRILQVTSDIDARLTDLINVLGWSFDANIISSALTCKQNISQFRAHIDPDTDRDRLRRIEMYLDIDAAAGGALERLYNVLGTSLRKGRE